MDTLLGSDPANYYVWRAQDGFAVHLSLQLIRELGARAEDGDPCGLLLGRSITTPLPGTVAEAFVEVAPLHDFQSARLQIDRWAAARPAQEGPGGQQRVVGYFRLQHGGQLTLGERDLRIVDQVFSETGNIALLIRSLGRGKLDAALFYWQDGRLQPGAPGFPFDGKKVRGSSGFSNPLRAKSEGPAQSAPRRTSEPMVAAPSAGIRWSRLWPTAAIAVTGIVATQLVWNPRRTTSADSSSVGEVSTPSASAGHERALGLNATSQPHLVEIRWNRAASAITTAVKGTMRISEAGVTEAVPFEAQELREGSVSFFPKTNDIHVEFEVTAADGATITEAVRVAAIP
jgi:hypothetical protein